MAKFYDHINEAQQDFIRKQHMYFVASAPLDGEGHVNLSPKGLDSFRIFSANKVGYMDMTGSGNETSAHLLENGRITIMFCAFDGPPNILRLYGRGHAVLPGTPEWEEISPLFALRLSTRQIIVADIYKVQTSCGYAVPLMDYVDDRDQLDRWADAKGEQGLIDYRREKNGCSLDDLPTPMGLHEQAKG
jgi:hypothetical protein